MCAHVLSKINLVRLVAWPTMSEVIALNKRKQGRVTKKVKNVKDKVKKGLIHVGENVKKAVPKSEAPRGLIYVGHIPHGFYEIEMKQYFSQFGKVTNVRVCRSRRTGNSKGYGFVEFAHSSVAEIAAETMNNYLMFNRKLVTKYIPPEKYKKKHIFKGRIWSRFHYPLKAARKKNFNRINRRISESKCIEMSKKQFKLINKKLKKLGEMGIAHNFKPVDRPDDKVTLLTNNTEWEETYIKDPYDSDIEIKVKKPKDMTQEKKSKKSLKTITKMKNKLSNMKLSKIKKDKMISLVRQVDGVNMITKKIKNLQKKNRI